MLTLKEVQATEKRRLCGNYGEAVAGERGNKTLMEHNSTQEHKF